MINKDMLHILQVPIKELNPIKLYQMILNYFKGNKHHHVERARKLLAQHRLSNGDIVRDLSHLKQEQVGIFTSAGCQFFPLSVCREALNIMSKCSSTFYGLVKGGVYVYAPHGHSK